MGESVIYNDLVVEGKVKTSATDEGSAPEKIATVDSENAIRYRTSAEIKADLGIDQCALKSDIAELQPKGNYLEVSAEDYVENAHVWFRNSIWANSISCNNLSGVQNFTAAWLKSSSVSDLNAVPNIYPVFRDDKWIYSRTRDEMKSDLGVNDKLDKATFSTRAPTASDGKSGDFWIQV